MSGFPELTADRARPSVRRPAGGRLALTLGEERTHRLDRLARAHGTTRPAILLTAYQLLIGRRTGTPDATVVVASPGGVPRSARLAWDDTATFSNLLDSPKRETDETDDTPASATVLFGTGDSPGLPLDGRFDLACLWDEATLGSDRPHGLLAYDTDLFDPATVERFRGHYLALLDSALTTPGAPLRDLTHTTPEERELVRGWSHRAADTRALNIVETFRAQAEKTPGAVAVRFPDGTLDYGTLQERAARLAERLAGHGVTPESVVGLAMEPSTTLITAMLAVLTTGAAYLPLDPGHPEARLAHMLADSGARMVLADRDLSFAGDVPVLRAPPPAARAPGPPGPRPRAGEAQGLIHKRRGR
ncbi:AMP-binding protein, partial [Streptomyces sp. NPDC058486]|uniref:AMP-binding protein n=1 Tax=Streptomyces sp. NPDC058486 TaxID=3346526 RepID=UPI00365B0C2F